MAENDALKEFDWSSFGGSGLFVKWEAGKPLTLRVLTVDPVVSQKEFNNNDEINLSTQFSFIVYNFTDQKAQILSASPSIARKISELHADPDFGADIKKIDIKITPTGEKLQRKYDIQVLQKVNTLTVDQIKECAAIKLDEAVKGGSRMSMWTPKEPDEAPLPAQQDTVIEDIGDEPINLDDIPF